MFTFLISAALLPAWPGAPEWLSSRVLACGMVAVGLVILSLLLKGLQKVITLLIAAAVVLGGVWFVQDTWTGEDEILPPELAAELNGLASRALESPDAKEAWSTIQAEWMRRTGDERAQLAAGGDRARAAIARHLDSKAADLRRQGKKAAADDLARLRAKIAPTD